jgi:hypothetical protein
MVLWRALMMLMMLITCLHLLAAQANYLYHLVLFVRQMAVGRKNPAFIWDAHRLLAWVLVTKPGQDAALMATTFASQLLILGKNWLAHH